MEAHVRQLAGIRLAVLPDALFQTMAGTESTQGVIALIAPPSWTLEQLFRGRSLVVVLDGVQDPGNAGTIVRAAEAFGATGVCFSKARQPIQSENAARFSGIAVSRPFRAFDRRGACARGVPSRISSMSMPAYPSRIRAT